MNKKNTPTVSKDKSTEQYTDAVLSALYEQITDSIYFKDLKSRFIWINRAQAQHLGLQNAHEAIGKTDFDFFSEEHARTAYADEQEIIRTGKSIQKDEEETYHDRPFTWASTVKMPFYDSDGHIIGTFGVSRDITDKKKLEEENRQMQEELKTFAYRASHDLQEPLRKITSFGDLLRRECCETLSQDGKEYLAYMLDAGCRLQTLIQALLQYSRIRKNPEKIKIVNLNEIVEYVMTDLDLSIRDSGAHITIESLPNIQADPIQMHLLMQNLLSNAVKFVRPGVQPEILINGHIHENFVHIQIKDNGTGFKQEYANELFGMFNRFHRQDEYQGTGIGLSICKKIVEYHDGRIRAIGEPDKGATFIIELPVSKQQK